ncbi:MAG: ribosome small subunit-dependent GTPase A [Microthrixaceae bacterium]
MTADDRSAPVQRPPAWDVAWEAAWQARSGDPALVPVRVVRIDKGGITTASSPNDERLVVAAKAVRRVVVGDVCALDAQTGRIEEILDRRTVFERRAPGAERVDVTVEAKALAANMDVVLVLQAVDSGVNTSRLARELVLAWDSGARPVVVLTKADMIGAAELEDERRAAQRYAPQVPVVCVSVVATGGTEDLDAHLTAGTVAVLLGASGAGKSTLANSLAGRDVQLTAEVREGDQRGRHTTTAGQMLELTEDRWLIDTPGIRGVGLWHSDEGLERAFADLSPFAQRCRFADCTHGGEPGCGIQIAIDAGELDADRLATWHSLVAEVERLEAEAEVAEREEKRDRNQRSRRRAAAQRGKPRR